MVSTQTFRGASEGKDFPLASVIIAESESLKPFRRTARSSSFIFSSLLITKPPCAKIEVHRINVKETKVANRVMLVLTVTKRPTAELTGRREFTQPSLHQV